MIVLMIVLAISVNGLVQAAGGNTYTLVYPEDEASQRQIKNEITEDGIGEGSGGLEATRIYSKDGKLGTQEFSFDRSESDKRDMLVYTKEMYCTLPGGAGDTSPGTFSSSAPADSTYIRFTMAIATPAGVGGAMFDSDSYPIWVGVLDENEHKIHIYKPGVTNPTNGAPDIPAINRDIGLDVKEPFSLPYKFIHSKLQTDNWLEGEVITGLSKSQMNSKITKQCVNHIVQRGSPPASNYQKLSDSEKTAWDTAAESAGLTKPSEASATPADNSAGTGTNCQGGALGWILCPLIDYMTQGLRVVAGLIDGLMQVRFLAQDDSSKPIELAWRAFLSVANILLVVAFMVIIFSQSTSLGLSNYGIKRMLPRLVIAAILMNISFYICALAIDISNIVGSSIMGFLVGSGNSIADSMTRATGGSTGLLGSATNVGISAVLVFIAIMFLVPVVLSVLLVFIMLIGRQVVLMVLVLVSPLAFVAWLLPNTEKYFKKWYGLFSELLILYPLVMLVFGASLYMANVIGGSNIFDNINLTPF